MEGYHIFLDEDFVVIEKSKSAKELYNDYLKKNMKLMKTLDKIHQIEGFEIIDDESNQERKEGEQKITYF
jgi:hypothetical protein